MSVSTFLCVGSRCCRLRGQLIPWHPLPAGRGPLYFIEILNTAPTPEYEYYTGSGIEDAADIFSDFTRKVVLEKVDRMARPKLTPTQQSVLRHYTDLDVMDVDQKATLIETPSQMWTIRDVLIDYELGATIKLPGSEFTIQNAAFIFRRATDDPTKIDRILLSLLVR